MCGAYIRNYGSPGAETVFAWMLAITLGGWVFIPWWLQHHPGDLWSASVPIKLIIGPAVFLQMRLNDRDAAYTDRICCVDRSAFGNMGN
jgi:hypothetical protein